MLGCRYFAQGWPLCHAGGSGRGSPFTIAAMTRRCTMAHVTMYTALAPNATYNAFFMMFSFTDERTLLVSPAPICAKSSLRSAGKHAAIDESINSIVP